MSDLVIELQKHVLVITLNRIEKHNAFDDILLNDLRQRLEEAAEQSEVRVIVIKANGRHFSAGADLTWMQRMAEFSEEENIADATVLAQLMATLHHHPKPTMVMIQGAAFGGGAGLVAAADIAIAANNARFCFSETKLGLIPAVISPYVIKAIGERAALALFMSAEIFDGERALQLGLVHHCTSEASLSSFTLDIAQHIAALPTGAVQETKSLVRLVAPLPLDEELQTLTAALIAKRRASEEAKKGVSAFLNKQIPKWD